MLLQNIGFTSQGYEDLRVPLSTTRVGGDAPTFSKFIDNGSGSTGVYAWEFVHNAEKQAFFNLQFPHGWLTGGTVYPHIHWSCTATGAADKMVNWGLEYTISDINSAFANTTIIYGDTPVGWTSGDNVVADKHYMTNIGSGISLASITGVSAMMFGRIFRDVGEADNLEESVHGLEFDLHYVSRRIGSPAIGGP